MGQRSDVRHAGRVHTLVGHSDRAEDGRLWEEAERGDSLMGVADVADGKRHLTGGLRGRKPTAQAGEVASRQCLVGSDDQELAQPQRSLVGREAQRLAALATERAAGPEGLAEQVLSELGAQGGEQGRPGGLRAAAEAMRTAEGLLGVHPLGLAVDGRKHAGQDDALQQGRAPRVPNDRPARRVERNLAQATRAGERTIGQP